MQKLIYKKQFLKKQNKNKKQSNYCLHVGAPVIIREAMRVFALVYLTTSSIVASWPLNELQSNNEWQWDVLP